MNIGGSALSKVASQVLSNGGGASGLSSQMMGEVAKLLGQGAFQVKHGTALIARLMGGGNGAARMSADGATRLRLTHILEQALEKAQRPGGNPQTQINDLLVRLQNLARESSEAKSMPMQEAQRELDNLVQKRQQMFQMLSSIMKQQHDTAQGVIQKIGR